MLLITLRFPDWMLLECGNSSVEFPVGIPDILYDVNIVAQADIIISRSIERERPVWKLVIQRLTMMNRYFAYLMPVLEEAVWRKVGSMYLYIKKNLDIELDQLVKPLYTKVNLSLILIHIISKSLLWSNCLSVKASFQREFWYYHHRKPLENWEENAW